MTDTLDEPLLTEAEAAALLRLHPRTLARLRRAGRGPMHLTINTDIRYRRADLAEWLSLDGAR
jgi:hypothetical protein